MPRRKQLASPAELLTAFAGALAEWLFAMSPLIVVTIVMIHLGKLSELAQSPEWSFGASIMGCQALVKFVVGVARVRKTSVERILLGASALLVIVVGPANIVLALVIHGDLQQHHVSFPLATLQVCIFILASLIFILFACAAHLAPKSIEIEPTSTA